MEPDLSKFLTIRKMRAIHSTQYDNVNRLYVLNVTFQGERNQETIFLPEWLLQPPEVVAVKDELAHVTVEIDIDESSPSLEISRSKENSQKNHSKLPMTAIEELRQKVKQGSSSTQKKEEEEFEYSNLLL